jgi:hypothetical protein
VSTAVKTWFKSDIETIKEHTAIAAQEDNEESEIEESNQDPEAAELTQVASKPLSAISNNLKEEVKSMEENGSIAGAREDPNANQFIPSFVHFSREGLFNTEQPQFAVQNIQDMAIYSQTLKDDERFQCVIEDAAFENLSGDLVDFAFVAGISHLNLQGIGKASRSAKLDRFQEILETLHALKPANETPKTAEISTSGKE